MVRSATVCFCVRNTPAHVACLQLTVIPPRVIKTMTDSDSKAFVRDSFIFFFFLCSDVIVCASLDV